VFKHALQNAQPPSLNLFAELHSMSLLELNGCDKNQMQVERMKSLTPRSFFHRIPGMAHGKCYLKHRMCTQEGDCSSVDLATDFKVEARTSFP
jgi:hypothetical protein